MKNNADGKTYLEVSKGITIRTYYKTTSSVEVYVSNDNGKYVGRSTGGLKDDIYYKNKLIQNRLYKN